MFDSVRHPPQARVDLRILAVAVLGTATLAGGLAWLCLWVLSLLGYSNLPPAPIEVSYTPFDDGRTLEEIQAEEAKEASPDAPESVQ